MDKSKQASKARERRLRAKYRRNIRVAVVLCLVIGLAVGFVAGRMTASVPTARPGTDSLSTPTILPTSTPEVTVIPTATVVPSTAPAAIVTVLPTAEPTEAVTVEPSAEATAAVAAEATAPVVALPTVEPTAKPVAQAAMTVIPFGQTQNIPVQVYSDGSPRNDTQPLPYEELNFQMTVSRFLDNDYYVSNYGSTHRLEEGTAGVEFELMLDNYQGATVIDPNKLIKNVSIETADGMVTYGYRLTNAEISGSDSFTMQTNVPMMLYKRFVQGGSAPKYLVVTVKIDGVDHIYKFEMASAVEATAEPAVEYTALSKGDKSDAVKALQARLIEKGYLEEGSDDGIYGNGTAEAVKAAQTDLDMEADGVASPEFQSALFEN